jgi:hypothetical protein
MFFSPQLSAISCQLSGTGFSSVLNAGFDCSLLNRCTMFLFHAVRLQLPVAGLVKTKLTADN